MEGLQRSETSFRRQGSSGLVWDDKLLSGELKKLNTGATKDGGEETTAKPEAKSYKTVNVAPSYDPPSPKVSGCGVCGMFGKPASSKSQSNAQKRKRGNRK